MDIIISFKVKVRVKFFLFFYAAGSDSVMKITDTNPDPSYHVNTEPYLPKKLGSELIQNRKTVHYTYRKFHIKCS